MKATSEIRTVLGGPAEERWCNVWDTAVLRILTFHHQSFSFASLARRTPLQDKEDRISQEVSAPAESEFDQSRHYSHVERQKIATKSRMN